MSDVRKLIAEARARGVANRLGKLTSRETDKDLVIINRLMTALEAATSPVAQTGSSPDLPLLDYVLSAEALEHWELSEGARKARGDSGCVCVLCQSVPLILEAGFSHPVGGETATEYGITVGYDQQVVVVSERRALAEATFAASGRNRPTSSGNQLVQRTVVHGTWAPVFPEQGGGKA